MPVVSDDDAGERWVYLYLIAETDDVLAQIADVDGLARRHRL